MSSPKENSVVAWAHQDSTDSMDVVAPKWHYLVTFVSYSICFAVAGYFVYSFTDEYLNNNLHNNYNHVELSDIPYHSVSPCYRRPEFDAKDENSLDEEETAVAELVEAFDKGQYGKFILNLEVLDLDKEPPSRGKVVQNVAKTLDGFEIYSGPGNVKMCIRIVLLNQTADKALALIFPAYRGFEVMAVHYSPHNTYPTREYQDEMVSLRSVLNDKRSYEHKYALRLVSRPYSVGNYICKNYRAGSYLIREECFEKCIMEASVEAGFKGVPKQVIKHNSTMSFNEARVNPLGCHKCYPLDCNTALFFYYSVRRSPEKELGPNESYHLFHGEKSVLEAQYTKKMTLDVYVIYVCSVLSVAFGASFLDYWNYLVLLISKWDIKNHVVRVDRFNNSQILYIRYTIGLPSSQRLMIGFSRKTNSGKARRNM